MQSGSLLFRMANGYRVATRMDTDFSLSASGLIARVSVRQSFLNDGPEWVEGIYVFPLPDDAAVDRLRMHIGERFIEGEIREKTEARKAYERAKTEGKKASLVEQQRPNMFTTSVANVAPGEKVVVEIEYLQLVRFEAGNFSLRLPLTITPRYITGSGLPDRQGSGWSPDTDRVPDASLITPPVVTRSRDHRLTLSAEINPGVPLEYIASRYHRIDVAEKGGRYRVTLTDGDQRLDHDVELVWRPVPAATARAMVFTETLGGEPHVLLLLIPPNDTSAPAAPMPRELIFVIDTSGSMHGTSIDQARRALILALQRLKRGDRFNVIQFNSVTSSLYGAATLATPARVEEAKQYVRRLKASGGTEMRPALERALATPSPETHLKQVLFITDGSVGNEHELFSLIEGRLGSARLFTVGIGSAPNGWFMRKAADAGRGSFTYISALHEVGEKMARLTAQLEQPQVTDIDVRWPLPVESYPETVPDLYQGEPILVRARLEGQPRAGDRVVVGGVTSSGGWGAELALPDDQSPGVAAIWARARIEDLLDRQRRGANADQIRRAVIETALSHHLVSKFTSLVAVDKTPVRPASAGLSREQVPNLLPHGQSMEAIFGFPATATSAPLYRSTGYALLLIAAMLMFVTRRRHAAA